MCIGCEAIKKHNINNEDDFSVKLDCLEKIFYKIYSKKFSKTIKKAFVRDINLTYHVENDIFYIQNFILEKNIFTLNLHKSSNPLKLIDELIKQNKLVVLKTRFDLLQMYSCSHYVDKKENTNHFMLIVSTDSEYIYFVEDYYILDKSYIDCCSSNNDIYRISKKALKTALLQYAEVYSPNFNDQLFLNVKINDSFMGFFEKLIYTYKNLTTNNNDLLTGIAALEQLLSQLKDESSQVLYNQFFTNHFTAHLMAAKRSILRESINEFFSVETKYKNTIINLLYTSENMWNSLKMLIIKNINEGNKNQTRFRNNCILKLNDIMENEKNIFENLENLITNIPKNDYI